MLFFDHMVRLIAIIIIAFTFFSAGIISTSFNTVYAQSSEIKTEKVNPGDDAWYILKRLKEKIILTILSISSDRKANYYKYLLNVRLGELKHVTDEKDIANIQTTSQRYSATAGQLADYLIKKNLNNKKEDAKNTFKKHINDIEEMKKKYQYDTAEWRFLEYDVSYLKTYTASLE